jgi:hypothetical protein
LNKNKEILIVNEENNDKWRNYNVWSSEDNQIENFEEIFNINETSGKYLLIYSDLFNLIVKIYEYISLSNILSVFGALICSILIFICIYVNIILIVWQLWI